MPFADTAKELIACEKATQTGAITKAEGVALYDRLLTELFDCLAAETTTGLFRMPKKLADQASREYRSKLGIAIEGNIQFLTDPNQKRTISEQLKIAFKREHDLERLAEGHHVTIRTKPWHFLPPGRWPRQAGDVSRLIPPRTVGGYAPERILSAISLQPSPTAIYHGDSDFSDYMAFEFGSGKPVLLESPIEGNAAYILRRDWEKLSRLTKFELTHGHQEVVTRVFHRSNTDWRLSIQCELWGFR